MLLRDDQSLIYANQPGHNCNQVPRALTTDPDVASASISNAEIAALTGAKRKQAIDALAQSDPSTYAAFISAKRHSEALNEFARTLGRFDFTARGKVNTYVSGDMENCPPDATRNCPLVT